MSDITYPSVYIEEIPDSGKPIVGVSTSTTAFLGRAKKGPSYKAERCLSYADFYSMFGNAPIESELSYSIKLFFENGGTECYVVKVPDGWPDIDAALAALDEIDLVNLMVIPPDSSIDEAVQETIRISAVDYCVHRSTFLLLDAPRDWPKNVQSSVIDDFRNSLTAESVAVFYPRVVIDGGKTSPVIGATGAIAGVMARTDAKHGVWKAPAGSEADLRGVIGLEIDLTDAENGRLNAMGVNCLRKFPTYGIVNWGARTLAGADSLGSDWKYIPVRRLALFIEESVRRGTQWAVFEPVSEQLWAAVRLNISNFMTDLWRRGAFVGNKPEESFFVICDRTTMTQDDIDNGRLNIQIGMAPVKPAEFIIIYIQQITGSKP